MRKTTRRLAGRVVDEERGDRAAEPAATPPRWQGRDSRDLGDAVERLLRSPVRPVGRQEATPSSSAAAQPLALSVVRARRDRRPPRSPPHRPQYRDARSRRPRPRKRSPGRRPDAPARPHRRRRGRRPGRPSPDVRRSRGRRRVQPRACRERRRRPTRRTPALLTTLNSKSGFTSSPLGTPSPRPAVGRRTASPRPPAGRRRARRRPGQRGRSAAEGRRSTRRVVELAQAASVRAFADSDPAGRHRREFAAAAGAGRRRRSRRRAAAPRPRAAGRRRTARGDRRASRR